MSVFLSVFVVLFICLFLYQCLSSLCLVYVFYCLSCCLSFFFIVCFFSLYVRLFVHPYIHTSAWCCDCPFLFCLSFCPSHYLSVFFLFLSFYCLLFNQFFYLVLFVCLVIFVCVSVCLTSCCSSLLLYWEQSYMQQSQRPQGHSSLSVKCIRSTATTCLWHFSCGCHWDSVPAPQAGKSCAQPLILSSGFVLNVSVETSDFWTQIWYFCSSFYRAISRNCSRFRPSSPHYSRTQSIGFCQRFWFYHPEQWF